MEDGLWEWKSWWLSSVLMVSSDLNWLLKAEQMFSLGMMASTGQPLLFDSLAQFLLDVPLGDIFGCLDFIEFFDFDQAGVGEVVFPGLLGNEGGEDVEFWW